MGALVQGDVVEGNQSISPDVTLEVYIRLYTIQISHIIILPRFAWRAMVLQSCSKLCASCHLLPATYYRGTSLQAYLHGSHIVNKHILIIRIFLFFSLSHHTYACNKRYAIPNQEGLSIRITPHDNTTLNHKCEIT